MINRVEVAIVSTIKHVSSETADWIQHHLDLSVSRIYLFIDQPGEEAQIEMELQKKFGTKQLKFIHKNNQLIESWKTFPSYNAVKNLVEHFVTVRQALNIEYLLRIEKVDHFKWIFHLDDDELIHLGNNSSISEYLQAIPEGYDQLIVFNYEAIPEDLDTVDFFSRQLKFKKSPTMVSQHQIELFNQRFNKPFYFTSYTHGKFAFSPKKIMDRDLWYIEGVHRFHSDASTSLECNFLDIAILHFPFPTFGKYFAKFSGHNRKRIYEYEALGEKVDNFYTQSRKFIAKGNPLDAEKFYSENVVYSPEEVTTLGDLKLLFEINKRP